MGKSRSWSGSCSSASQSELEFTHWCRGPGALLRRRRLRRAGRRCARKSARLSSPTRPAQVEEKLRMALEARWTDRSTGSDNQGAGRLLRTRGGEAADTRRLVRRLANAVRGGRRSPPVVLVVETCTWPTTNVLTSSSTWSTGRATRRSSCSAPAGRSCSSAADVGRRALDSQTIALAPLTDERRRGASVLLYDRCSTSTCRHACCNRPEATRCNAEGVTAADAREGESGEALPDTVQG